MFGDHPASVQRSTASLLYLVKKIEEQKDFYQYPAKTCDSVLGCKSFPIQVPPSSSLLVHYLPVYYRLNVQENDNVPTEKVLAMIILHAFLSITSCSYQICIISHRPWRHNVSYGATAAGCNTGNGVSQWMHSAYRLKSHRSARCMLIVVPNARVLNI